MADDDPNLADAADYDLVPVDHVPQFADAPVPKAGQTVAPPNVAGQLATIPSMVGKVAADVTGVSDAYRALSGQMTPEEQQQMFVMALPGLIPGARAETTAMKAAEEAAPAIARGIRAYHGSPYDFDQFDLSKIGTGEGAQAYGHGLYFAENPLVSEEYRKNLVGYEANVFSPQETRSGKWEVAVYDRAAQRALSKNKFDSEDEARQFAEQTNAQSPKGKMYEVNINADPEHFLDWDKPLSEQSPAIKDKAIAAFGAQAPTQVGQGLRGRWYTADERGYIIGRPDGWPDEGTAREAAKILSQDATRQLAKTPAELLKTPSTAINMDRTNKLRDAGIPGIKYLDQGSRNQTTWIARHPQGGTWESPNEAEIRAFVAKNPEYSLEAPKQTKNYVVFNDKLIDIVKKYGLAGVVGAGASHFQTVPVDHQPDFGDQHGMATGGAVQNKVSKAKAHYRGGSKLRHCSICTMFQPPNGCRSVRGQISPQALCDFFERVKDAKTLYVMRPLLNAGAVVAWAKSQGFKKTVKPTDMHVTIAFSRDKVDHNGLKRDRGPLVASRGKRTVKPLGDEGAVVLTFESSDLSERWKAFREIGASWDWESYQPHVTITYDGEGLDLKGVKPYMGPLRFGPEQFSELDEGWKDKIKET